MPVELLQAKLGLKDKSMACVWVCRGFEWFLAFYFGEFVGGSVFELGAAFPIESKDVSF